MIVEVKQGKLKGIENESALTRKPYYSFFGIPYGKPPLGELRFRAPEPAENWEGVRDATKEGKACTQEDLLNELTFSSSEDCLILNVYTPEPPTRINVKKPVMVFIHGGSFIMGSASPKLCGPGYLMDYDVIFVTIQYRLHILGFLNMGIPSCPGNAGLKDQTLALKWIKENIGAFGGDSDNITIFGESAGGSSVHLHMISPASKGLFNKAIAQSGNAFCPWSLTSNPTEEGFAVGKALGFQGDDPEKLVEFLRGKSAEELSKAAREIMNKKKEQFPGSCYYATFVPSVEAIKENAFLPDSPENLQRTATPIPFITGFNDKEGLLIMLDSKTGVITKLLNDFSLVVKNNFFNLTEMEITKTLKKVEEFYFQPEGKFSKLDRLLDVYTDIFFMKFYLSYESFLKSGVPVYLYEFSFDSPSNFVKSIARNLAPDEVETIKGAAHGDDLGYLFSMSVSGHNPKIEEAEKKMIETMCSLWTNFARTGNPTQGMSNMEWKPSTVDKQCYMKLDRDLELMPGRLMEDRLMFWKTLLAGTECQF